MLCLRYCGTPKGGGQFDRSSQSPPSGPGRQRLTRSGRRGYIAWTPTTPGAVVHRDLHAIGKQAGIARVGRAVHAHPRAKGAPVPAAWPGRGHPDRVDTGSLRSRIQAAQSAAAVTGRVTAIRVAPYRSSIRIVRRRRSDARGQRPERMPPVRPAVCPSRRRAICRHVGVAFGPPFTPRMTAKLSKEKRASPL